MPLSTEQARLNGQQGGRPVGSRSKVALERERVARAVAEQIMKKARPLVRAGMTVALGQQFVYRIDEEFENDTVKVDKKTGEEIVTKGQLKKRVHVLVTDPEEIARALDQIEGMGVGGSNNEYYYITTKEPDYKAIEMLLSRALGKPKESIDLNVDVKLSLVELARSRDTMLDGNPDVRETPLKVPEVASAPVQVIPRDAEVISEGPSNDLPADIRYAHLP